MLNPWWKFYHEKKANKATCLKPPQRQFIPAEAFVFFCSKKKPNQPKGWEKGPQSFLKNTL